MMFEEENDAKTYIKIHISLYKTFKLFHMPDIKAFCYGIGK
jgi:hypothetical protein